MTRFAAAVEQTLNPTPNTNEINVTDKLRTASKKKIKAVASENFIIMSETWAAVCGLVGTELKLMGYIGLDQVKNAIEDKGPKLVHTPILPMNTIFYGEREAGKKILVIQQMPQTRTINFVGFNSQAEALAAGWKAADDGDWMYSTTKRPLKIHLPYLQFYFSFTETEDKKYVSRAKLSCSNKPIQSMEDPVYLLPINNVYPIDAEICWGTNPMKNISCSIAEYGTILINHFWSLSFNNHYVQYQKWPDLYKSYTEWGKITLEDAIKAKYQQCSYRTLGAMIHAL